MRKIQWFINRLLSMTIEEIKDRIIESLKYKYLKFIYRRPQNLLDISLNYNKDFSNLNEKLESIFNKNNLEFINEGYEFTTFLNYNLTEEIDFHKGSVSRWPHELFCKDIDYKNCSDIGDVRLTWEVNRFQFFPYLALGYITTKDKNYLDSIKLNFYSWLHQNPYLKGVNWMSPMEVAIRSYQWLITYYLLYDVTETQFKEDIIKSIIISMKYVRQNFSMHSSANNHLIIEAYITSIIGYCLDDIYKQDWYKAGNEMLKKHLPKQFFYDGVNKEQALHYQAFVTDALLQYNFFLRNIGASGLEDELLRKSIEFIGLVGNDANYVEFGDSDDAKIITTRLSGYNYYEYILQLGSQYFGENFAFENNLIQEISIFSKSTVLPKNSVIYNKSNLYKLGGYYIYKDNNLHIMFDFGPLGFGKLATHGHADALAVVYQYNNVPFFIDSGTYIYNGDSYKRNYYRSTYMHNTLSIDKQSQSIMTGPGMWGKRANAKLLKYEFKKEKDFIVASHDGYKPKIHKRTIEINKENYSLKIWDNFSGNAQLNYILDPDCKVKILDKYRVILSNGGECILFKSNKEISIENIVISNSFYSEKTTMKIIILNDFDSCSEVITEMCPISRECEE